MNKELQQQIIRLSLPIALQQFMTALVSACDTVMLGSLSQSAMSAVSLATQFTFVFNLFMAAYLIGENMFVAQYYGRRDYAHISQIAWLVLRLAGLTAILFWLSGLLIPHMLMQILTSDPELVQLGSEYLRMVSLSYLFSAVTQVCTTIMKNCGAVNMSTAIHVTGVVSNIILNALLIYGLAGFPEMGISGAALATVIATIIQAVWSVTYIAVRMTSIHLLPQPHKGESLAARFWSRTAPVLCNELAWGGGVTMYSVIMGHLGADAVAANGIANVAKNLIICLCFGLGSAGSIIVGNLLGDDRFDEARQAGRTLIRLSIVSGILAGLSLLVLSPLIMHAVTLTEDAQHYLRWMLLISSYYLIGKSVNCMTIGGIFPAGGDSRFGMFCDAITMWCVTVPLGCLCAFVWKTPVMVVYFVLNLDEIVKLPAVYRHYRQYKWVQNIVHHQ